MVHPNALLAFGIVTKALSDRLRDRLDPRESSATELKNQLGQLSAPILKYYHVSLAAQTHLSWYALDQGGAIATSEPIWNPPVQGRARGTHTTSQQIYVAVLSSSARQDGPARRPGSLQR